MKTNVIITAIFAIFLFACKKETPVKKYNIQYSFIVAGCEKALLMYKTAYGTESENITNPSYHSFNAVLMQEDLSTFAYVSATATNPDQLAIVEIKTYINGVLKATNQYKAKTIQESQSVQLN